MKALDIWNWREVSSKAWLKDPWFTLQSRSSTHSDRAEVRSAVKSALKTIQVNAEGEVVDLEGGSPILWLRRTGKRTFDVRRKPFPSGILEPASSNVQDLAAALEATFGNGEISGEGFGPTTLSDELLHRSEVRHHSKREVTELLTSFVLEFHMAEMMTRTPQTGSNQVDSVPAHGLPLWKSEYQALKWT